MPTTSAVSTYLGYSVSALEFLAGVILVSGLFFKYVPDQLRIMCGVVLMLLGIYRFVVTRYRMRQQNDQEKDE
jgi:uncharacterized membrane protein